MRSTNKLLSFKIELWNWISTGFSPFRHSVELCNHREEQANTVLLYGFHRHCLNYLELIKKNKATELLVMAGGIDVSSGSISGWPVALQWRHNGRDGVSNHQPNDCFLNRLFRCRSRKTPKLRVTGLCEGNSPVTGEFHAQRASNAENVSIWWPHYEGE